MVSIASRALTTVVILGCACVAIAEVATSYEIPQPKFKLLKSKGFQVSIPDEPGVQLFAFHGNLNKKMAKMANGQFSMDIIEKQSGKWIYQNRKLKVRAGDVIYYWVFVIKNGVGYRLDDGVYEVSDSDMKYTSKKPHNLKKRYVSNFGIPGIRFYIPSVSTQTYENSNEEEDDKPFGYGPGHGFPHHQQGRGQYRGPHTPEFHGPFGFPHNHGNHGNHGNPHNLGPNPGQFHHNHGHHGGNGHGNNGNHWGHHHNGWGHHKHDDCDSAESESNSDETNTNERDNGFITETTTKPWPVPVVTRVTTRPTTRFTTMFTTTRTTTTRPTFSTTMLTPEPEAENPETTTPFEPQIDIRFGDKTK